MTKAITSVVLAALAAPSWAQIHVPGDHPDPQAAVAAASPGDVIVVHGGTWTSTAGPALVIDKPLVVIGDPMPTFEPPLAGMGKQPPAIALVGSGDGSVVLANVATGGLTSGFHWSLQSGGLTGGGFAQVRLYECAIAAPRWFVLTGIGAGSSGIDVDVPYLLLSHSTVTASDGADDGCYGIALDGRAGARSTGTVVALDSAVIGGTYLRPCFPTPGCGTLSGGEGGSGIEALRVDEAGSTIAGGAGAAWSDVLGNPCGSSPDGPAVEAASHVVMAVDLAVAYPTRIGGSVALAYDTPGPALYLFYSSPAPPAVIRPALGPAYLRAGTARLAGVLPAGGGPAAIVHPVPAMPALLGIELAFQGVDLPGYVTRPVSVILTP